MCGGDTCYVCDQLSTPHTLHTVSHDPLDRRMTAMLSDDVPLIGTVTSHLVAVLVRVSLSYTLLSAIPPPPSSFCSLPSSSLGPEVTSPPTLKYLFSCQLSHCPNRMHIPTTAVVRMCLNRPHFPSNYTLISYTTHSQSLRIIGMSSASLTRLIWPR